MINCPCGCGKRIPRSHTTCRETWLRIPGDIRITLIMPAPAIRRRVASRAVLEIAAVIARARKAQA